MDPKGPSHLVERGGPDLAGPCRRTAGHRESGGVFRIRRIGLRHRSVDPRRWWLDFQVAPIWCKRYEPMNRNMRLLAVATMAVTSLSAQLAVAAPAPPPDLGPNKSVRPTAAAIPPSVGPLLGWEVGISSAVFGPLTFSDAAGLADALGLATIEGDS